jgi:hypothetical protein
VSSLRSRGRYEAEAIDPPGIGRRSEYLKDVLALGIGTGLVMLVWLAIGGGTYRLSPDTEAGSRSTFQKDPNPVVIRRPPDSSSGSSKPVF